MRSLVVTIPSITMKEESKCTIMTAKLKRTELLKEEKETKSNDGRYKDNDCNHNINQSSYNFNSRMEILRKNINVELQ